MKSYREKEMKYLLIVYSMLLLIWCTDNIDNIENATEDYRQLFFVFIESAVISGVISLIVFISDSLYSSKSKDKLVNLFFLHRSAEVVFTKIKNGTIHDDRFTRATAKDCYKSIIQQFPEDKNNRYFYENSCWYKIYSKYIEKGSIQESQKDYLLCRDLFIETITFIIVYIASIVIFQDIDFSLKYFCFLVFMAVITNIATHNKMTCFVNNVIAVDIASRPDIPVE